MDLPIACTLSAGDIPARAADVRALGRDGLESVDFDGRRAILRFRDDAAIRERVARFVAGESECCAFLSFTTDGATVTIDAPAGGESTLADLVALLRAPD